MVEENVSSTFLPSKRQRPGEAATEGSEATSSSTRAQAPQRRTATEILRWMEEEQIQIPETIHSPWSGSIGRYKIFCYTEIGGRRSQEDRFCVCPRLVAQREDCALFGVYDGTVGDFASDTVKNLVMPHLCGSSSWVAFTKLLPTLDVADIEDISTGISYLEDAMTHLHVDSDLELIDRCAVGSYHYAASTSATCLLAGPFCCVGHLGDSRIALGYLDDMGTIRSKFLTTDHKPDQPAERERILASKGSVEYLVNHNRKPFIRGGDFTVRKSRGEQPMQLQYSRAFGGKDLKMYGLSRQPDVHAFQLSSSCKCLIVASDGLWDVRSSDDAVRIAFEANRNARNPADMLVDQTVKEMAMRRQAADNITAIVIFMDSDC